MRTVTALLLTLSACNTPPADVPPPAHVPGVIGDVGETVFTVTGHEVGSRETDLVFARMGVPADQIAAFTDTPMGRHVLEDYALATLLYYKALDAKLYEDPDIQLQMAFSERQALSQAMRNKLALDQISEEKIEAFLTRNEGRFNKPQVHARQIVVTKESLAKELVGRIEGGEDFAELAKVHSTDASTAGAGGDLGWFTKGDNPLIGDSVFVHSQKAMLLGPIESRMGYHVVEILDRRDVTPKEEARAIAMATLEKDAALEAMAKLREELKVEWVKPLAADPHAGGEMPEGHPPTDVAPADGAAPAPAPAPEGKAGKGKAKAGH